MLLSLILKNIYIKTWAKSIAKPRLRSFFLCCQIILGQKSHQFFGTNVAAKFIPKILSYGKWI